MFNQAFSIKNMSQHVIGITSVSDDKKSQKHRFLFETQRKGKFKQTTDRF
jgi:hypothetical protein